MKKEFASLICAITYFTRIKIPMDKFYSLEAMQGASKYMSLVGFVIGTFSALVYWMCTLILPQTVSIVIMIISSILLTGALHEDGFADVCDGFGGGWTKEKILEIMKDSRIGAYGAIGLTLILLLKYVLLTNISLDLFIRTIIISAVLSRGMASLLMYFYEYARTDNSSKAKSIVRKLNYKELIFIILISTLPLFLIDNYLILLLIPISVIVMFLSGRYYKKWIGGYTGDCIGATQQIIEIVIYLFVIVISRVSDMGLNL